MQTNNNYPHPALLYSLAILALYLYMDWDNVAWGFIYVPGAAALAVVFRLGDSQRSYRYLWPTLAAIAALVVVRSSTVFYFACCCAVLLAWEWGVGRRSVLALLLLAALSAFAQHISYVWSFPIRMQLGAWAAQSISLLGMPVEAEGNVVVFDGQPFSIDPACIGLHLLMTTMVLGIFTMAMREQQTQRRASAGAMVGGFTLLLLLAVLANFVRILALILFRILPTDPMHDVLGLLSLGVYALLPFHIAWRWWTARYAAPIPSVHLGHLVGPPLWQYHLPGMVLLLALAAVGGPLRQPVPVAPVNLSAIEIQGYEARTTELGVYQLSKTGALVYIKPPVRAFQGGHDPRICWQGSGYTFTHIHTRTVAGHTIYQATLELADDRLHTAWWYDNGTLKTINEWQWRRATLLGDTPFRLVNVTTDDPARLDALVREWLVR